MASLGAFLIVGAVPTTSAEPAWRSGVLGAVLVLLGVAIGGPAWQQWRALGPFRRAIATHLPSVSAERALVAELRQFVGADQSDFAEAVRRASGAERTRLRAGLRAEFDRRNIHNPTLRRALEAIILQDV